MKPRPDPELDNIPVMRASVWIAAVWVALAVLILLFLSLFVTGVTS